MWFWLIIVGHIGKGQRETQTPKNSSTPITLEEQQAMEELGDGSFDDSQSVNGVCPRRRRKSRMFSSTPKELDTSQTIFNFQEQQAMEELGDGSFDDSQRVSGVCPLRRSRRKSVDQLEKTRAFLEKTVNDLGTCSRVETPSPRRKRASCARRRYSDSPQGTVIRNEGRGRLRNPYPRHLDESVARRLDFDSSPSPVNEIGASGRIQSSPRRKRASCARRLYSDSPQRMVKENEETGRRRLRSPYPRFYGDSGVRRLDFDSSPSPVNKSGTCGRVETPRPRQRVAYGRMFSFDTPQGPVNPFAGRGHIRPRYPRERRESCIRRLDFDSSPSPAVSTRGSPCPRRSTNRGVSNYEDSIDTADYYDALNEIDNLDESSIYYDPSMSEAVSGRGSPCPRRSTNRGVSNYDDSIDAADYYDALDETDNLDESSIYYDPSMSEELSGRGSPCPRRRTTPHLSDSRNAYGFWNESNPFNEYASPYDSLDATDGLPGNWDFFYNQSMPEVNSERRSSGFRSPTPRFRSPQGTELFRVTPQTPSSDLGSDYLETPERGSAGFTTPGYDISISTLGTDDFRARERMPWEDSGSEVSVTPERGSCSMRSPGLDSLRTPYISRMPDSCLRTSDYRDPPESEGLDYYRQGGYRRSTDWGGSEYGFCDVPLDTEVFYDDDAEDAEDDIDNLDESSVFYDPSEYEQLMVDSHGFLVC